MLRKYFKHADNKLCAWLCLHKKEAQYVYVKRRTGNHHWEIYPFEIDKINMDYLREIEDTWDGFTSFYIEIPKQ